MGVQLNIKDPETVRLARELADATGEPITRVIRLALERELQRREEEFAEFSARVKAISREFVESIPPEMRGKSSKEWMDDMYDEDGLPK